MKIVTERLILRDPKESDAPELERNINNINVVKWLLVVPYPYTGKDAKWYINKHRNDFRKKKRGDYAFLIELKETGKIIGGISMSKVDYFQGAATVGYWLGQDYWRFGYGSEALKAIIDFAFKKLKLRRLEAQVYEGNPSSGKLLEKYGFKQEGFRRKSSRCKATGKIHNDYWYGLLREDWKK